jgi:hypothetical protein
MNTESQKRFTDEIKLLLGEKDFEIIRLKTIISELEKQLPVAIKGEK